MYHIVYDGCLGSGRQLSILATIERLGIDKRNVVRRIDGVTEYKLLFSKGCHQYDVIVTVSKIRSWLASTHDEAPDLNKSIENEIERLCSCDGIIFVIDSRQIRKGCNLVQLSRVRQDLASQGVDIDTKPVVFQVNQRDRDDICCIDWVREHFHTKRCAYVESVAIKGIGVLEALEKLFALVESQETKG